MRGIQSNVTTGPTLSMRLMERTISMANVCLRRILYTTYNLSSDIDYYDISPSFWSAEWYDLQLKWPDAASSWLLPALHAAPGAAEVVVSAAIKRNKTFYPYVQVVTDTRARLPSTSPPHHIDRPLNSKVPQYFLVTLGEILVSVTGLEFSYSQSPLFMKSVLQMPPTIPPPAARMQPGSALLSEPATEFFAYAALMVVVMALFIMLAMRYQYR
ncbi:unnamed protein product [Sphagnum balticum]